MNVCGCARLLLEAAVTFGVVATVCRLLGIDAPLQSEGVPIW